MKFPAKNLKPVGGQIYSHIHENSSMGLARGHFWSFAIDFASIKYGESEFECSMTTEWIQIPERDWQLIGNHEFLSLEVNKEMESSFYMTEHDTSSCDLLSISRTEENLFRVRMDFTVDFLGYYGDDADPEMKVSAEAEIEYTGLIIVPGNLETEMADVESIVKAASDFVDVDKYDEPNKEEISYVFRPKW